MLTKNDIISIDFRDKWFQQGLDYALLSWTEHFNRLGKPNPYTRLQKIILGVIAEKAVESYFKVISLSFEASGKTKWYQVDRYDLGLKNYAIDVKANFLDHNSAHIKKKRNENRDLQEWLTKCHALVPLDQFNPGKNEKRKHTKEKLFVFPFIEGCFDECNGTDALVHTFWDYQWLKKAECKALPNLGNLIISYSGKTGKSRIKIYGTTSKNKACIEVVDLESSHIKTKNNFFQVFSILWEGDAPSETLFIESPILKLREEIKPQHSFHLQKVREFHVPTKNDWQNLTLLDAKIHILGWIDELDLRVEGRKFARFSKNIEQYSETKVDNWGCLATSLNSVNSLKEV